MRALEAWRKRQRELEDEAETQVMLTAKGRRYLAKLAAEGQAIR